MPSGNSPLPTPWKTRLERLSTLVLASSRATFSHPASPPPQSCASIVKLEYAEPEFAGSVKAILSFHCGSARSAQAFGALSAGTSLVFCRIVSRWTLVPIHRSAGSRNCPGTASLFLDAYGASKDLLALSRRRLTPHTASPSGRSRSD